MVHLTPNAGEAYLCKSTITWQYFLQAADRIDPLSAIRKF